MLDSQDAATEELDVIREAFGPTREVAAVAVT